MPRRDQYRFYGSQWSDNLRSMSEYVEALSYDGFKRNSDASGDELESYAAQKIKKEGGVYSDRYGLTRDFRELSQDEIAVPILPPKFPDVRSVAEQIKKAAKRNEWETWGFEKR